MQLFLEILDSGRDSDAMLGWFAGAGKRAGVDTDTDTDA